jgi:hypothetical protein
MGFACHVHPVEQEDAMRYLVLIFLGTFALAAGAESAPAAGPLVGPGVTGKKLPNGATAGADIGAGPHLKRGLRPAPRDAVEEEEVPAADHPAGNRGGRASTGSSRDNDSSVGSSGADNDAIERDEDRANQNKDKFKHRPGYKEDVPLPRASKQ